MDYDLKSIWDYALSTLDRFKGLFILLSIFSIHLVSIVSNLGNGLWIFIDATLISQLVFKLALTVTLAIAGKEFLIFFVMITLRTFSDSRFVWLNSWMLRGRRIVESKRDVYVDVFFTIVLLVYIYSPPFFTGISARFFYIVFVIYLVRYFFKFDLMPALKPSKESLEIETAYRSTGYGLGFVAVFIAWDMGISRAETIVDENIVNVRLLD